ncbi:MAG: polyprenyl synthetase family protein [Cyanobacteria bacterium RUI128]|nr:polyprenyl synthetase family protein [Cyanobacteria bacterium RUI128]
MTETLCKLSETEVIKNIISENLPYAETDFGKMIRSNIGLLFLKSHKVDTAKYLPLLGAAELIHLSSLLHDDVIDNDDIRRGKPSIRSEYNNKTSVLYGDLILSNALRLILSYNSAELSELFNATLNNMCRGELMQYAKTCSIPSTEEYIEKSRLKTASLFEFITEGINVISEKKLHFPLEFGTNFGIGFQIKNDLDNILKNKTDIRNGIYTAPVIFSGGVELTNIGIEKTRCLIDNYRGRCMSFLSEFEDSIYKE